MFRKFFVFSVLCVYLPGVGVLEPAACVQAAPTASAVELWVADSYQPDQPMNGLRLYKWYYCNSPTDMSAFRHDYAAFKLKGWAVMVRYVP